jgi:hypothetical protein
VFEALDADKDGIVTKHELLFWFTNERSWKQVEHDRPVDRDAANARAGGRRAQVDQNFKSPHRARWADDVDRNKVSLELCDAARSSAPGQDNRISFQELDAWTKDFDYRDLRALSDDQVYIDQLRDYARNPTPENERVLRVAKQDREFLQREGLKERDSMGVVLAEQGSPVASK